MKITVEFEKSIDNKMYSISLLPCIVIEKINVCNAKHYKLIFMMFFYVLSFEWEITKKL